MILQIDWLGHYLSLLPAISYRRRVSQHAKGVQGVRDSQVLGVFRCELQKQSRPVAALVELVGRIFQKRASLHLFRKSDLK